MVQKSSKLNKIASKKKFTFMVKEDIYFKIGLLSMFSGVHSCTSTEIVGFLNM